MLSVKSQNTKLTWKRKGLLWWCSCITLIQDIKCSCNKGGSLHFFTVWKTILKKDDKNISRAFHQLTEMLPYNQNNVPPTSDSVTNNQKAPHYNLCSLINNNASGSQQSSPHNHLSMPTNMSWKLFWLFIISFIPTFRQVLPCHIHVYCLNLKLSLSMHFVRILVCCLCFWERLFSMIEIVLSVCSEIHKMIILILDSVYIKFIVWF